MTGGPPDVLSARHRALAALEAAGWKGQALYHAIDLTPTRISIIRRSVEYQAELRRAEQAYRERVVAGRLEEVEALWPAAREAKEYCLSQRDNLAVANAAADSIFDRLVPKRREGDEGVERVLRVVITREDEARIAETAKHIGEIIDVSPDGEGE